MSNNKKILPTLLLIPLFVSIFSFSQSFDSSFDEDFLESLPKDIRDDLLSEVEAKEQSEDAQYRRPSTFIEKSSIEIERFGYEVFNRMQTSFMPLNEPNFDGNYILDFGDVLQIQLTGQESDIYKVDIKRDGSISIPDIGKIFISGLSLQDGTSLIRDQINKSFIGVNSFITLTSVRDVQVIVSGNVYSPGPYTLNGNSNAFHALSVAGGPSETGSFRKIDIIRNGSTIETIDLYDTFIFGRPTLKTRLRSGDLIFVNPIQNLVTVSGGVKRPYTYELIEEESLYDVLAFSNGLSIDADLNDIKIFRLKDGNIIDIAIESIEDLQAFVSQDRDTIVISKYKFRTVSVNGAVKNPGNYFIKDQSGILDAIELAGGYAPNAYPFGGILENELVLEANLVSRDSIYRAFIKDLLTNQNIDDATGLTILLEEFRDSPVSGRVMAEFDIEKLRLNPELDTILQDKDKLIIPEKTDQIFIFGEVLEQGTVRFNESFSVRDYVNLKGGFSPLADTRNVYILLANGKIVKNKRNLFESNEDLSISPGAIIYVPRKIRSGFFTTQAAQVYTQILSNLGVSLASIATLKD